MQTYLENFYQFCMSLDSTTANVMQTILQFEADRRAFIITINFWDWTYYAWMTESYSKTISTFLALANLSIVDKTAGPNASFIHCNQWH